MLYGMTTRFRCADPQPIWKVWDAFAIDTAEMIGYWEASARRPVHLACADGAAAPAAAEAVLATSYVRRGNATLVALASWAKDVVRCELRIDFGALGLDARHAQARAPAIDGFQEGIDARPLGGSTPVIDVEPGRGWLLFVEHRSEARGARHAKHRALIEN